MSLARSAKEKFRAGDSPGLQYFRARKSGSCSPRRSSGFGSRSKQYENHTAFVSAKSNQCRNHCFESSTRNHCFDISPLALLRNQSPSTAFPVCARSCFDFHCFDCYPGCFRRVALYLSRLGLPTQSLSIFHVKTRFSEDSPSLLR